MTSVSQPPPVSTQSTGSSSNAPRPTIVASTPSATAGAAPIATAPASSSQHGKSSSISPINGKPSIPPAVPNMAGGPMIVNSSGGGDANGLSQSEHAKKPSTTPTAPSGSIPNGGPVTQPAGNRNSIQFGSMGGSPAPAYSQPQQMPSTSSVVSTPQNPRVTSPQNSPSPIPIPTASGGRPPSALQGQGNEMSFGSMGGETPETNRQLRPVSMSQAPNVPGGGPQPSHLRRESSQSGHGEMGAMGPARGGYNQGGRGRGYNNYGQQQQQHPMGYQQNQGYRGNTNPQRGGPNMGGPYPNQPGPIYSGSPRPARSPHLQNSLPGTPSMGAQPMVGVPGMAQGQQFYHHAMNPQAQYGMAYEAAAYGQYGYPPQAYGVYPPHMGQHQPPPTGSPRPGLQPYPSQGSYQGHQAAQSMSRTASGVSEARPPSAIGHTPSSTPGPAPSHRASHSSSSPAPSSGNFKIPKRSGAISIVNPKSGAVLNFDKQQPSSPAASATPPAPSSTSTPPPKPEEPQHSRSDSKSAKSNEEVQNSLKEQIAKKLEAEKLETQRKEEVERKEAEEKAAAEKAEKEAAEAEARKKAEEEAAAKAKEEEEKAQKAEEERLAKEKAEQEAKAAAEAEATRKAQAAAADKAAAEESAAKKIDKDSPSTPAGVTSGLSKMTLASGTSTPKSEDSSMGPPAKSASQTKRDKPAQLDLKLNTKPVEPAQPSAAMISLGSARFINRLLDVTYPKAIASPNPSLNANNKSSFKYDKNFLLQFQRVFKEKPQVDWDNRLKDTVGDPSSGPQSARTPQLGGRGTSGRGSAGPMQQPFNMGAMGSFAGGMQGRTIPPGTTSEQRFREASGGMRPFNNPVGQQNRPPGTFPMGGGQFPISRTSSSTNLGPGAGANASNRSSNRSTRGGGSKRGTDKPTAKQEEAAAKAMPLTAGADVAPLKASGGGWKPRSIQTATSVTGAAGPAPGGAGTGHMEPDMVQRKVKSNLNKMTPEKFEKIADQILEITAQSKDETDGRTMRQVIQLTFEKATDEAHWASMYAKFCKRMLESMSPEIKDEDVKDKTGQYITGGALFRKYLLNRCQEEFERGWKMNLPPKPEGEKGEKLASEEAELMSEEYYVAAAAKRRGLGLVKFIGELYKLGMLTERIMTMCIKKLLDYEGIPDEAEVESLCSLLRTIGRNLDESKVSHPMMNVYFERIGMMRNTEGLPSRLAFMLLDIIDLRKKGWESKEADKGPKTIQEIHQEAQLAAAEKEAEKLRQDASRRANRDGGRMPMGRGDARQFSGPGGQFGMQQPPDFHQNKVSTDDLRKLGAKGSSRAGGPSGAPAVFGPSSMFGSRSNSGRKAFGSSSGPGGLRGEESGASSRTATPPQQKEKEESKNTNAFSALADIESSEDHPGSPPSTAGSPPVAKSKPIDSKLADDSKDSAA